MSGNDAPFSPEGRARAKGGRLSPTRRARLPATILASSRNRRSAERHTRHTMPAAQRPGKTPLPAQSEVAAAEVLAWVSDCIEGGLCFLSRGILIFENGQFGELVEAAVVPEDEAGTAPLRARLFADATAWNEESLGARRTRTYRLTDRQGHPLTYQCRFNVVQSALLHKPRSGR